MFLLVFLLVSVALAAATENGTSDPGIIISSSKMLVSITSPSIDLDLSDLGLRSLSSLAFENCASVRTVDLSNNWITKLSPGIFSSMTNLEHLSLAYNDLKNEIMSGAFRGLANLKSLDITHNPLSAMLENEIFIGLPNFCEIFIGISKNFHTITPLVFGKTEKIVAKNHTSNRESKNCPDRSSIEKERLELEKQFTFDLRGETYSSDGVVMDTDNTTLRFVDFSNVTDNTRMHNFTSRYGYELRVLYRISINNDRTRLKFHNPIMTSVARGWFRFQNTPVNAISMIAENFDNLTSDLLNDLPENVTYFDLLSLSLKRLNNGVMVNKHLRKLRFNTYIRVIEADAFAGMNLTHLAVESSAIHTLPESLLWLDLSGLTNIPRKSFSRLKNLLFLRLYRHRIEELQPPDLDGVVSLRWLDLSPGYELHLRPGVFRNLSKLHSIDLTRNGIGRLDKGVFDGMDCLVHMNLQANGMQRLPAGALDGLTDSLEILDLSGNQLEILEAGTFIGVPKFHLSLNNNNIWKIKKDAFDLPYLRYLDLSDNDLTTIEKGAAKRLGNLANETEIKLGLNPIEKLKNGALAGLSNKARVSLNMTHIKVIQAGVFDDA